VKGTEAVSGWWSEIRPHRKDVKSDVLAGLPGAISSVPDGMATALLAGVNPAYGLYASFAGKIGGGLSTSTKLMVVTTTTAASLAAGSALADIAPENRDTALITLTLLTGLVMVAAGLLHLGRYIRFVSRSVMLGFLTGVAVNIVFGQLAGLLGSPAEGGVAAQKAFYVITHPSGIVTASTIVGVSALVVMLLLSRTRIALFATLIAVVVPTVVVALMGLTEVATVADIGAIPSGLPPLVLPRISDLSVDVITGALAIAAIALVQGAGVAEAAPNPDGKPSRMNRDFVGQGVANMASGFFHGTPVGGSVSSTALNVAAGARSRWASIYAGLWMLLILVALSTAVGLVPMPTLSAVLIFAAVMSLRFGDIGVVWKTSTTGKIGMLVTFAATLALPVAAAVGVGVICSLMLQLNKEQMDLRIVRLIRQPSGLFLEQPVPAVLPDAEPVVLDVYGSLLYAGARTLGSRLPDPRGSTRPVVILRLRGRTSLGSTFFGVVAAYADALAAAGGRLYLSGVQDDMVERFRRSQVQDVQGKITVFHATQVLGESTMAAVQDARTWLVGDQGDPEPTDDVGSEPSRSGAPTPLAATVDTAQEPPDDTAAQRTDDQPETDPPQ
jgi:SulP family sulfate permease